MALPLLTVSYTTAITEDDVAVISTDDWAWQNPLPYGNQIMDIWGTSASNAFAVGMSGSIIHYNRQIWSAMYASNIESGAGVKIGRTYSIAFDFNK